MKRICMVDFQGVPQSYVAQIDLTTEVAESMWGPHETSRDDLGEWISFAFVLSGGALVALVREMDNAPHPGYILTSITELSPRSLLAQFMVESGLSRDAVLHEGFE